MARQWKDGLDILIFRVQLDRYCGDHKPSFEIELGVLNLTLINFNIYNIHHVDCKDDDDEEWTFV